MGKLRPTGGKRLGYKLSEAETGLEPRVLVLSSRIRPGSAAPPLCQEHHIFSNMKRRKKDVDTWSEGQRASGCLDSQIVLAKLSGHADSLLGFRII